jgi:hypothetical protein
MKEYPSILRATGTLFREIPNAYIFDKLDGSSLRSEWNFKKGWYKHGRRHGLLDDSNNDLKMAPELFNRQLAEPLSKLAKDNRWKHLIVFYEFWGVKSLGGQHEQDDPKFLTIFDAAIDKKGILGPSQFRSIFEGKVDTAQLLDHCNWTRGYVERVRMNDVDGITSEGVVAKAGTGHSIIRAKAKTQAWIDKIIAIHGESRGRKIVES